MNEHTGVYAGSFDPPTVGHVWMIERGSELFDQIIVAVGVNPDKKPAFSVAERLNMLQAITTGRPNVVLDEFTNDYLVRYAERVGARYILRGIRSENDFDYERVMRQINADIAPGITTVFLVPPRAIAEVSSSMVRGLIGPAGWEEVIKPYLSAPVYEAVLRRYHAPKT